MSSPFTYFYVDRETVCGDSVELSEEETRHMRKVCRVSDGDVVYVTDGRGNVYRAAVRAGSRSRLAAHIEEQIHIPAQVRSCHLAVPLAGDQKLDWLIEKCTEIGVCSFLLFRCDRSRRGEAGAMKQERHRRIARAAMKQSMRAYLPEFEYTDGIDSLIRRFADFTCVLLGHLDDSSRDIMDEVIGYVPNLPSRILVIVGPEAGFSQSETSQLISAGARPVAFGRYRLRMETAAVVLSACVVSEISRNLIR